MKKIIFISLSVLIISLLASCHKDTYVAKGSIKGRVLALHSTDSVVNAKVYLYKSIWSGSILSGSANTILLDSTQSNNKGEYSFLYNFTSGSEFFVRAYAKNYYTSSNA